LSVNKNGEVMVERYELSVI